METAQKKVEEAVNKMLSGVDNSHLRQVQVLYSRPVFYILGFLVQNLQWLWCRVADIRSFNLLFSYPRAMRSNAVQAAVRTPNCRWRIGRTA